MPQTVGFWTDMLSAACDFHKAGTGASLDEPLGKMNSQLAKTFLAIVSSAVFLTGTAQGAGAAEYRGCQSRIIVQFQWSPAPSLISDGGATKCAVTYPAEVPVLGGRGVPTDFGAIPAGATHMRAIKYVDPNYAGDQPVVGATWNWSLTYSGGGDSGTAVERANGDISVVSGAHTVTGRVVPLPPNYIGEVNIVFNRQGSPHNYTLTYARPIYVATT